MTYLVKVSKPGKSIHSADQRDLSIDTSFSRILRLSTTPFSGSKVITMNPDNQFTQVNITHGLSYKPFYQVFMKWTDSLSGNIPIWQNATGGSGWVTGALNVVEFASAVTDSTIYLVWNNNTFGVEPSTITATYRVFVGQDPLP